MNLENIKSIEQARAGFASGAFLPSDLTAFYLKNIEANNKKGKELNIYLEVFADVMDAAKMADAKYKDGSARELEGIPFAIKDCILIKGKVASSGSKMLESFVAAQDATAIKLLRAAGAVLLGRTNMDEFAMGGSGENSAYGPTKNPLDVTRVPGGTSSGSAAAVAANMCLVALGSDTGGSVRQPGSFTGVYGYKPSYGGVSRSGLIAAGSSLDQIGILANNIKDVETVYKIIGKEDVLDGTSIPAEVRREKNKKAFSKSVCYIKSAIDSEGVSGEVRNNFYAFIEKAKAKGYGVNEINNEDLSSLKYALAMYYIIMPAEVSTNLSRMEGLRFGGGDVGAVLNYEDLYKKVRSKFFGKEAKRRIIIGSYVLSHGYYDAYYGKATAMRKIMKAQFAKIFKEDSIFLSPTAPTTAFKLSSAGETRDPLTLYMEDIFTVPANLAELPGISIPSGFDSEQLPFGIQALAGYGRDQDLFDFAKDF